ncbi:MAG: phosphate starvation-inducible protein PhoH [Spirochaetes bacterium RBG_16_67_19]|nr:MAG: phosphate starvation-inducible protein PhoH [Spirochaetes bacterium RBG_16_67_19]
MRKHLAVALKNPESIQELFGANDDNLAVFEELLGIRIYLQGNQIYIDAANASIRGRLEELLAQLQEHLRLGNAPNPDLIRAVHSSLSSGRSEGVDILKETMVVVPNGLAKTFPRSHNQALYLQAIERHDLVFGIGPAGTGKTYLAVALALKAVLGRSRRKLILTRPVVEAGENLGFLPGDLEQKISPYLRPLYDAMESLVPMETIRRMEENRILEIAPLAYMRGRTLSDCFIILDEAQNTTREQMKMFLTRIGEGSKAVVTGDITQIDLPRQQNSGLLNVIPVLERIHEIAFIFLGEEDVVRHPLVRKIVRAYQDHEQG